MVDALSNWQPKRCVVVGASGGIGAGFVEHLLARDSVEQVYGFARSSTVSTESDRMVAGRLDYADVGSIEAAA
ncbi:MAG: C-factor, partial [Hyphomicrobiales bacterium]|nr:C-factor [Hyphomicrobiales bacterium]